MRWSERCVRAHKRQTDCAVHRASAQLAVEMSLFETFHELLYCARKRAVRLFEAPIVGGRHLGVEALVHLARFRHAHLRPLPAWEGTPASWRPVVASLARHLVCEYDVPAFLASSWYASDAEADTKRDWFLAHSRGACFRSLKLPMVMTRKMEHLFLASHDHLSIEYAMRRAELIGLGMPPELVKAILMTRMATDLQNSEFWRTVWLFLIAHARELESVQIGPLIDYIQAVHQDERVMAAQAGMGFYAARPTFSMKGRTVQSMLRLMGDWHRSLGMGMASFSWTRSPYAPLQVDEPAREGLNELPRRWQMMELVNSAQLRREGSALHHCVASYADRCYRGMSSIWSLRVWQGERIRHVLTVEVDPKKRAIVQARGVANRAASGRSRHLLEEWAARERLQMTL